MLKRITQAMRTEYSHVSPVLVPSSVLFIFFIGWGVVGPFFSINAKNILTTPFLVGLFISLWGITRLLTDFIVGALVDVSDAKRIVSISLMAYFFVGFGYYFIDSIPLLLLWRIFHSICGSFFWVGIWGYLHKTLPAKHREENITFNSLMSGIPSLFAPFFGAIIFTVSNPKNVFLVMSAFSVIASILFMLNAKKVDAKRGVRVNDVVKKEISVFKKMGTRLVFLALMFIGVFTISTAYETFMPIYLFEQGYSSVVIALVAVTGSIPLFFVMPIAIFADKIGRRPVLWWGTILAILSLIGLYFSTSLISILISVLLFGFALSVIFPTANALVGDMAVDGEQGAFAGLAEMFKDIGALSGPFIGGLLVGAFSFKVMIATMAGVALILLILTGRFHEQRAVE